MRQTSKADVLLVRLVTVEKMKEVPGDAPLRRRVDRLHTVADPLAGGNQHACLRHQAHCLGPVGFLAVVRAVGVRHAED
jgi:hypothetical protein